MTIITTKKSLNGGAPLADQASAPSPHQQQPDNHNDTNPVTIKQMPVFLIDDFDYRDRGVCGMSIEDNRTANLKSFACPCGRGVEVVAS
jgi:hypothetical protein